MKDIDKDKKQTLVRHPEIKEIGLNYENNSRKITFIISDSTQVRWMCKVSVDDKIYQILYTTVLTS